MRRSAVRRTRRCVIYRGPVDDAALDHMVVNDEITQADADMVRECFQLLMIPQPPGRREE